MTKGELRRMRKRGELRDVRPVREVRQARRARRQDAMWRWARRYDARNGAPEGPEDC